MPKNKENIQKKINSFSISTERMKPVHKSVEFGDSVKKEIKLCLARKPRLLSLNKDAMVTFCDQTALQSKLEGQDAVHTMPSTMK